MRRLIVLLLAGALALGCLTGCGAGKPERAAAEDRLQIVVTVFPAWDWLEHVLGENPAQAEVTWLLRSGVDLHSYQPTVEDILRISACDLFIYVGGESDGWVKDALREASNPNRRVLSLLDALGDDAREEERVEGMQPERGEEEEESALDEHVWLSLRNAAALTEAISKALQELDPAHAEDYRRAAASYTQELRALDGMYQQAVDAAGVRTLLFADRFPFRYLTEDYGLSYYAAFAGCSAETEASFETILFLARKTDELGLPAVLTLEGSDHRIAETVVQSTGAGDQKILELDSMQSVREKDAAAGKSYLSIMESNLAVLREALGQEAGYGVPHD